MKEKEYVPKEKKKAWPTKDAMAQVYALKLWGGDASFYSGEGSHNDEIVQPYLDTVKTFLSSFEEPLVVCDLGCGDFNIGKELVEFTEKYIALDIVPELIDYNKLKFQQENLEFHCLDIAEDTLPVADCIILRQVLQHLSNAEILNIVEKLVDYKLVILTEHLPNEDFRPNVDIISGQGTRLKKGSGVDLLAAPFNLKIVKQKKLLDIVLRDGNGVILTSVFWLV
ncbi:MAG: class I SAM-dependent methyltransferase [Patiriisocius sp.]|uniref:class I SAM-dependent methyltransferase n=1 Tax=Patiriisocius sp. TaxID=2822396 RepID=UPI003EF8D836